MPRSLRLSSALQYSLGGVFALFAGSCFAADGAPANINIPMTVPSATSGPHLETKVEGISAYRFANGLVVLLAPDASKPTTTVNVTYLVGSRMESYGETGMAHLLEHLMFKGTPAFPDGAAVKEFARRGMQFNGSTWLDRTNYHETFPASDDNLSWALKMEADRMVNSFIARSDLDSEMTVVRNEMESDENSPSRILWQKMAAAAFQWHSYGKDTIGARSDVELVDITHLQAFYHKYYQPDNAVLTIAGKFDEARALQTVIETFGALPQPARKLEPTYTVEPVQDGPRSVTLERAGDNRLVGLLYHVPAAADPDFAATEVLMQILGDTPNGRLHRALVATRKASSVSADAFALREPGYVVLFSELSKQQSADEVKRIMVNVVENIKKQPVTDAEIKRAQRQILNEFEKELSDPTRFGVSLSEAIAQGDWRLLFLRRDRVEAVKRADVERVAESFLKESNRTLGEFVPTAKLDRAPAVTRPDVRDMVASYKGREAMSEGEIFDATPANIESRTVRSSLPNGMQVALLSKRTRGNTVQGELVLHMGDEKSLAGKSQITALTAALLTRGAGKMNRQQIADRLDELKTQLSITAAPGAVTARFQTKRDNLPEFLDLLGDIMRRPTFPASELDQLRNEAITGVEGNRSEPEALASLALGKHDNPYPKGDPRYAENFDEQIAAMRAATPAAIKDFHSRFYGANAAQLALVGEFDTASMQTKIRQLFGDWKARTPYAHVPQPYRITTPANIKLETPDKSNAFYIGGIAVPVRDESPDYPAMMVADRIFGGGSLKSRLAERLRQKDGISYGAGSALEISSQDNNSQFLLYAIFAPQNLGKVQTDVTEELDRLLKDGVTQQEVDDARNGLLQDIKVARTRDGTLATSLARQLELKRTMDFSAKRDEAIKAVTVEQVNTALRKYVDPAHFAQVYAGSFANPPVGK